MRLSRHSVGGWLLAAALCLATCVALWWWYLRDPLIAGLAWAAGLVSPWLWPDTVLDIRMQGDQAVIISLIPTLTDPPNLFTTLPLKLTRAVTIFPLFWGLTLATPGRGLLRRLLYGTLILLPVAFAMTLVSTEFQFALYRTHLPLVSLMPPPHFILALPDSPTAYYLWGLGRQLATLILPLLAPLVVWLGLHGGFLRRLLRQAPAQDPAP